MWNGAGIKSGNECELMGKEIGILPVGVCEWSPVIAKYLVERYILVDKKVG